VLPLLRPHRVATVHWSRLAATKSHSGCSADASGRVRSTRDTSSVARNEVLGVDWSKQGWVAVALSGRDEPQVSVWRDLAELLSRRPDAICIAVDMPIGLPEVRRKADELAREYVGARRNSVFITPPKKVLKAPSYLEANLIASNAEGGKKISQQAWALRVNIAVVEKLAATDQRIIEVHPEVSFRCMLGGEVPHPKNSWNGQALRREALAKEGIVLPDQLGDAGKVPVADVLDAAAAAWSARRYAAGEAYSLPPNARNGAREVIWY
jgi:predicted RNase H-like nuclease